MVILPRRVLNALAAARVGRTFALVVWRRVCSPRFRASSVSYRVTVPPYRLPYVGLALKLNSFQSVLVEATAFNFQTYLTAPLALRPIKLTFGTTTYYRGCWHVVNRPFWQSSSQCELHFLTLVLLLQQSTIENLLPLWRAGQGLLAESSLLLPPGLVWAVSISVARSPSQVGYVSFALASTNFKLI